VQLGARASERARERQRCQRCGIPHRPRST